MNNNLLIIQKTIMREIERLDNCKENIEQEVARSNSITGQATTFIKSINVQLRIKETAEKYQITKKSLNEELGIE